MSSLPPNTPADDRWSEAIREIVRQEVAAALPYAAVYEYSVISGLNNVVNAVPVDSTRGLPPVQNIPIRTGVPGAAVQLTPGTKLAIGFFDANPTKPYVFGTFDQIGALQIVLNTSTGTVEHITTIEGVCAMLVQLGIATAGLGGGWTEVQLAAAITTVAGGTGILPPTLAAIVAALKTKALDTTGLQPSVGCPNLLGG